MSKDPVSLEAWFPFYYWDFERSCDRVGMTSAERYGYLRVLANLYASGGYADDQVIIAEWSGIRTASGRRRRGVAKIMRLLTVEPAGITHPRVLKELKKAEDIRAQRSRSGRKGAKKRWG